MPFTLAQAAAETGLHRSSILRAIKRGAVSGSRDAGGNGRLSPPSCSGYSRPLCAQVSPMVQRAKTHRLMRPSRRHICGPPAWPSR